MLEATKMSRKPVSMLGPITESGAYQVSLRGGSTRDYAHSVSNYGHRTKPLWIVLDGLKSTHTLGSIIQTSQYMGVDGVVVCHHNSAKLSALVSRASNGALERAPTYTLSNLTRFIQVLDPSRKERGYLNAIPISISQLHPNHLELISLLKFC